MADIAPIAGVSLEQYANLCAAMADTGGDESRELAIAAEQGIDEAAWRTAKAGFTARMQDPADLGRTAMAFMPLYQAAQSRARGGGPPCTLETYAAISTSYSFEQDASGKQVDQNLIFARHGITAARWHEFTGYWTPRVNDPSDPVSKQFPLLVQAESDRIFGIHRDARGSRVNPDDPNASAVDREAARAAMAHARRPTPENPSAASPGAAAPVPVAAPSPAPTPVVAPAPRSTASPPAPPPPRPPVSPAPTPAAPAPSPAARAAGSTPSATSLTDEERMLGAIAHAGAIVGFAGIAPVVVWFLKKDTSPWVAWRAGQAAIFQIGAVIVIIVLGLLTCGIGTMLLIPFFVLEGWQAWQAWNGSRAGYPWMGDFAD